MTSTEKRIIDLLQAKREQDPDGFRDYLPSVADILPTPSPTRSANSPFGLTERELAFHKTGLQEALEKVESGNADLQDAVKGLQHYANIKIHDTFSTDATHDMAKRLFKSAFGKSHGSYKRKTTIPVAGEDAGAVQEQVTVLRGVNLELDRNRRLVSVSVNPAKVKEMARIMKIVGIIKDAPPDMAEKHDDYLAMIDPHGRD
jgi:hypothetical protein